MAGIRLPDISWLFIHGTGGIGQIIIERQSPGLIDEEGQEMDAFVPEYVQGYVSIASDTDVALASTLGVQVNVTLLVARGTPVDFSDEVALSGIDPWLDGRYRVSVVRPTEVNLRVLLNRTTAVMP